MMTDEELTLYDDAMKKGKYLEGASIVLGAAWRDEERARAERQRESREFWAAWQEQRVSESNSEQTRQDDMPREISNEEHITEAYWRGYRDGKSHAEPLP